MYSKDIKEDLKLNFKEFYEGGLDALFKKRYNLAVAAFFKSIAVLSDLKIYSILGTLPKNHNERFMILNTKFKPIYKIVSDMFKKYKESYNLRMEKSDAMEVQENVEKIKELIGFD
jgi:hypothetical protein